MSLFAPHSKASPTPATVPVHPDDVPRIFVSAANADLKSFRVRARDILTLREVFADIEENLPVGCEKIRDSLRKRIAKADAVVCLIGFAYGSDPPGSAALGADRRSYT